ncbi:HNH endonuclease [Sphingosinicella sp. BN140058]|uniref:HNH endonuclease n=1 Tax=Sphingosinicella sp. BN140058 TaxID=1892855 RepID=UPI0013EBBF98|nr:HNH endonuclease signature motif containing protein [Sphingosinicella sp. BN140058]
MKREVRRSCGFGCVVCGMPIFHYDHIVEFAEGGEHAVENLALLCPNHHQDKTSGRLSRNSVAARRANPHNLRRGMTPGYALARGEAIETHLGNLIVKDGEGGEDFHVLSINGNSFLTVHHEEGGVTFSARLTDDEGRTLLRVDHGSLSVSTQVWDYRYEGTRLSIRTEAGRIALEADFTDELVRFARGLFIDRNETGLRVRPNGSLVMVLDRLEVGSIQGGRMGRYPKGALAVVRESLFSFPLHPDGYAFARIIPQHAERQLQRMKGKLTREKRGSSEPA